MLVEQENKIIGMIYDAALNPPLWKEVLAEVVKLTGSSTAILSITNQLFPTQDIVFTHNISQECLRVYQDEQVKVIDMRLHAPYWDHKTLGDTVLNSFTSYANMPNTDQFIFYEKCVKPTNIAHVAAVLLERSIYSWAVFAVHRATELTEYSEQEAQILTRLGVHLRRALKIYRQVVLLENEKNDIYHVLDQLRVGVMLINQDLKLTYSNAIARITLEKTDILKLDQNNHLKTLKQYQNNLNKLIGNVLFEDFDILSKAGGCLALNNEESNESLLLSILPFNATKNCNLQKKAVIFMSQTNQKQYLANDYLVQRYKLAKRELLFCELFVNGQKLEQITENMNITYGTARMYIKNIFAKTGCTSQTELMQLLMNTCFEFEFS